MRIPKNIIITTMLAISSLLSVGVAIAQGEEEKGDYWKVAKNFLTETEKREFKISKVTTNFVITGEESKVPISVECTEVSVEPTAHKIAGGKPGLVENQFTLRKCVLLEPEPTKCKIGNGTINLEEMNSEIVENELVAKQTLITLEPAVAGRPFGRFVIVSIVGQTCGAGFLCPNMKGSMLAQVSNTSETGESKTNAITFPAAPLINYINEKKEKLKTTELTIDGKSAGFRGAFEIELNPVEEFGALII